MVAVCGVVLVAATGPVSPGCSCQRSRGTTTAVHGMAVSAILFSLTLTPCASISVKKNYSNQYSRVIRHCRQYNLALVSSLIR